MMSTVQYPVLIVITPLLFAFIISIVGWFREKYVFPLTLTALAISLFSAIKTLQVVIQLGPIQYKLGGWVPPFGIEYFIDHLNAFVLVIINTVGFLAAIYSRESVRKEIPDKIPQYYTLFVLQITGLSGITITGDAFNLYVLLEITALTGYAMISVGKDRAILSSFNYVIMGTIGACFYLLGVGHLYIMTGSLNMADLHHLLPDIFTSNAILVGFILILAGVWVKMAFFPVHGWLPNAYTFAPSATGVLIAPLMTKVSVYVMIRLMFSVFDTDYIFSVFPASDAVVWLAVIAIFAGAIFALAQKNIKKMLTYLIVSEVGYMVGGVWLGNRAGLTGAVLHILNDALMTLCLFMVAGIIVYKKNSYEFSDLKGMYKSMPFTMSALTLGALSMIGVPPTCGFFSKWYLLSGAIQSGKYEYLIALIFSSLVNIILFFKLIEIAYYGNGHSGHEKNKLDEAPPGMLLPTLFVALLLIIVGLSTGVIVTKVISYTIPGGLSGLL